MKNKNVSLQIKDKGLKRFEKKMFRLLKNIFY